MGIRDKKTKKQIPPTPTPPPPTTVKKVEPQKQTPVKIEAVKKVVEPKKEVVQQPVVKVEKAPTIETVVNKNEHSGIGLIGYHEELSNFKAICKRKRLKLGAELLTMIKKFNEQNG